MTTTDFTVFISIGFPGTLKHSFKISVILQLNAFPMLLQKRVSENRGMGLFKDNELFGAS